VDAEKRQVWFVCGWQVKLCDHLVTYPVRAYLSALEIKGLYIKHYIISSINFYFSLTASMAESNGIAA